MVAPVDRVNTPIIKVSVTYTIVYTNVDKEVNSKSLQPVSLISNPNIIPPATKDTTNVNNIKDRTNNSVVTYFEARIILRLCARINRNLIVP
ncbi:hypothetical protein D3C78_1628310 [compost metagenome]